MSAKQTIRVIHRQRLVAKHPGIWALESDPSVLFQKMLGNARLGPSGARYSVERWTYPGGEATAQSLSSAVRRWLAKQPKPKAQLDREIGSAFMIVDNTSGVAAEFHDAIVKAILNGGKLPEALEDIITLTPVTVDGKPRWVVNWA